MADEIVVAVLGLISALVMIWGFRVLPGEGWQFLAALPRRKAEDGSWEGVNLTFYGLFSAWAYVMATALVFLSLGARGTTVPTIMITAVFMSMVCLPASRLVAVLVERRSHTATVGGASFVGILLAPWCIVLVDMLPRAVTGPSVSVMDAMAALSIAYALGEGLGRLACVSFGCCYGRRLSDCPPFFRLLFGRLHFVFTGKTKKIAYADAMDHEPVVPIQAITSIVFVASALVGLYLLLKGRPAAAFLEAVAVTQIWRFLSELFRADFRGLGRLSAYQWMGVLSVIYAPLVSFIFSGPDHGAKPDVMQGLSTLWDPAVLVFLCLTGLTVLLFTGRSKVTGSVISFHVMNDRI